MTVTLPVENPDEPPRVDVHYDWTQHALWVSGRHGIDSIAGHEIGLSPELVRDLAVWVDAADALFNADDPLSSQSPSGFLETGFALAERVRAELPAEWVVTATHPVTKADVELPRHASEAHADGHPESHL